MADIGAPYRERLRPLVSGGGVEAARAAWAAERCGAVGPWRRMYGRLRPGRSPWAVLVYQAADAGPTVQVGVFGSSDSPAEGRRSGTPPRDADGRIDITRCEDDPALPGLRAVLAGLDDATVVRYRPGHRCTVRGRTRSGARYVKVLAEHADDQRETRLRWDAAGSGALSFTVAEPHGWDERTLASWYGVVPGRPVLPALLGPGGRRLAERIGRSLGELAVSPLRPERTSTPEDQLMRTQRALVRAAAAAPALSDSLARAGDALADAHQRLPERPLVPVHGAAHLGQWLVDDDARLGLVDFDRWSRGDPEFDLALLLVDLGSHVSTTSTEKLEEAVLVGFRAVAGEPDPRRLLLYAVHRRVAGVARTACAVRPDAADRAALRLEKLNAALAALAAGAATEH